MAAVRTAADLAAPAPLSVQSNELVDEGLLRTMARLRLWLVPVLDGRRLVGVIHYSSVPAARAADTATAGLVTQYVPRHDRSVADRWRIGGGDVNALDPQSSRVTLARHLVTRSPNAGAEVATAG